ncbi:MAG: MATE family efflux transporter [Kurthia sp.]|uniref:Probable multidrug resistance protein NorM n=1 Tax=Kurthia zopfii TaxID=1650 RepID=A0A2U3A9N9_9BACL|nr:MATE family efflux transporter [Kurthia zopfii]PWI21262.1 MATE family efflux transporter [Kurthia zopfii]TDR33943.1 MATE family multidrug resistance protein [Kurthia zopfii]STX09493.1 Na(+)/drug antiporter [Kurthia zopfii]VEI06566.1 Na(+)/drug antiporter [Kurthia zopfii]GEK31896.1 putative multidrug resistance protein NorM [Kurthia zopfii]
MYQTTTHSQKWKQLLVIITPILVTQIALYLVTFFDVLFSSKYGTTDLAGVSIGSSIWMPIYVGVSGILLSITPIVAQSIGGKKTKEATFSVQQGIIVAIVLALIVFALILALLNPILSLMPLEPHVHDVAHGYLIAMSCGLVPLFIYTALRSFIDALGQTRTSMFITLIATPINIFFCYVFIFGNLGSPALGGVGAGIASAITYWIICGIAIWITLKSQPFSDFTIFKKFPKPNWVKWKEILKIGFPIGLALFAETGIFAVVTIIMSKYTTEVIGAHQIAMNFANLAYMIPLSISMGATILIGFEIGAKRYEDAKDYTKKAIILAVSICTLTLGALILLRREIALVYSDDLEVVALATGFLIYAAFFQLSDAVQAPIQGALRGYKDVTTTSIMAVISYWVIALPLGYILADVLDFGPTGYWIGLISGLAVGAISLSIRLRIVQKKFSNN